MSPYSHYRGKSIGRILHFVCKYCGLQRAEYVTVGNGVVELHNKPFATFEWVNSFYNNSNIDVPEFTFVGDNADFYNREQKMKREKVETRDAIKELEYMLEKAIKLLERSVDNNSPNTGRNIDFCMREKFLQSDIRKYLNEFPTTEQSGTS